MLRARLVQTVHELIQAGGLPDGLGGLSECRRSPRLPSLGRSRHRQLRGRRAKAKAPPAGYHNTAGDFVTVDDEAEVIQPMLVASIEPEVADYGGYQAPFFEAPSVVQPTHRRPTRALRPPGRATIPRTSSWGCPAPSETDEWPTFRTPVKPSRLRRP